MPQTNPHHTANSPRRDQSTAFADDHAKTQRPASVTVGKHPSEVYAFVRDFENFPKFMRGLKEVKILSDKAAHLAFDHEGANGSCDVEKVSEVHEWEMSWKTLGQTDVEHRGLITVEPAPGDRGTVVSMRMHFEDEAKSKLRGIVSYFVGKDPKSEAYINLRRLKAYLETGEVPTIQGQSSGRDQ